MTMRSIWMCSVLLVASVLLLLGRCGAVKEALQEAHQAELDALVKRVEAEPCGCPGCCPPPIPRCCDPRCPKCVGGEVPVPERRCASGCPGGACPFQCPCDRCICCYTQKIFEFETRTCEDIAVLYIIGLEVSTETLLTTTTLTETRQVTFTADFVYVFTSVTFSTSLLSTSPSTTTVVDETTTTSTIVVALTTVTEVIPTLSFITFTSILTTTPTVDLVLSTASVVGDLTFEVSVLDSLIFSTIEGDTFISTDFLTSLAVIEDTASLTETVTIGDGSFSPELTTTAVEPIFETLSVSETFTATITVSETTSETITESVIEDITDSLDILLTNLSPTLTFTALETTTIVNGVKRRPKVLVYDL